MQRGWAATQEASAPGLHRRRAMRRRARVPPPRPVPTAFDPLVWPESRLLPTVSPLGVLSLATLQLRWQGSGAASGVVSTAAAETGAACAAAAAPEAFAAAAAAAACAAAVATGPGGRAASARQAAFAPSDPSLVVRPPAPSPSPRPRPLEPHDSCLEPPSRQQLAPRPGCVAVRARTAALQTPSGHSPVRWSPHAPAPLETERGCW